MDRKAIQWRALTNVLKDRRETGVNLSPEGIRLVEEFLEKPTPTPEPEPDPNLAALTTAVRTLATGQAELLKVLAELVQALANQPAPHVTVNAPPRRPLRLKRDDGSEAIIQEM